MAVPSDQPMLRRVWAAGSISVLAALTAACGTLNVSDQPTDINQMGAEAPDAGQPQQPDLPDGHVKVPPEQVDTLFQSPISGVQTARREVIDSDVAWSATWMELAGNVSPTPPTPEVDFSTHIALLVSMGERPSGGYAIEIRDLVYDASALTVVVREVSPGPGCFTTMALTSPALVVALPRVADAVTFAEESVTLDCG